MRGGRVAECCERGEVASLDHDVEDARGVGTALVCRSVPRDRASSERGEADGERVSVVGDGDAHDSSLSAIAASSAISAGVRWSSARSSASLRASRAKSAARWAAAVLIAAAFVFTP